MVGFVALQTYAQNVGSISGYIFNVNDSAAIPGATVYIKTSQKTIGTITDAKGHFKLKPIDPGTYTVIYSYAGLDTLSINGTIVNANLNTDMKKIYMNSRNIRGVEITFDLGLIDEDGGMITTMDHKDLENLPIKGDIKMVLKYVSSDFYVNENTQKVYFRGSRAGTSAYYIDGVRVEDMKLPGMGVGSIMIYSGGVPAQFGDFTGGVVVVETKSNNDCVEEKEARKRYLAYTEAPTIVDAPKEAVDTDKATPTTDKE